MRLVVCLVGVVALTACSSQSARVDSGKSGSWVQQYPAQGDVGSPVPSDRTKRPVEGVEYFRVRSGPGTTQMPGSSEATAGTLASSGIGDKFELNFQDADVRGVIDVVLGDILKLNYFVRPNVQGRITLRTGSPAGQEGLFSALEAALLSVGVVVIVDNGVYQVLTRDQAPEVLHGAGGVAGPATLRPGYAVEILPLRYVEPTEMQRILESVVPKRAILKADDRYRQLVVAGSSQERSAVRRTIESFDKDWLAGTTLALFQLEQTDADQLLAEIRQVFLPPMNFLGGRVRLVPIPNIRAVLGVAQDRADLEEAGQWIRRLDKTKASGTRLFVYNVQHGVAKDLVTALRHVLEGIVSDQQGNTVQANRALSEAGQNPASLPTSLVAIDETNSILYYGDESKFELIRSTLEKIDVYPRQVMIEAILAEVQLNDSLQYGVQWSYDSGDNRVVLSTAESGSVGSKFPGFSYIYTGIADTRLVLNALAEKTEVRVLSAPKLSVLNNQKASLLVGDQVPVVTQTSQGTSTPGAPVINSVELRDTGVILEVTPRVSDSGSITLLVTQEVSDVAKTTSSGIDSPTIQRRRIQTTVATQDGYTVALGGLIRENKSQGNSGIPLLKDIPLIGRAFRSDSSDSRRTELIVLMVPHVMRNQEETASVVDALVSGMSAASKAADHVPPIQPHRTR